MIVSFKDNGNMTVETHSGKWTYLPDQIGPDVYDKIPERYHVALDRHCRKHGIQGRQMTLGED